MQKPLYYLKDYKKECILGPLFKLLEASFELLVPLVVAKIIDVAIPTGDKSYLIKLCVFLVALGVVGFISAVVAQYFAAKAACGFSTKLKHALFTHIQSLSHTELDKLGSSTMITRLTSDMNQLQTGVNMTIRLFLRSPFVVFGAMAMAFTIDTKIAFIFLGTIVLLLAVVFLITLITIPLYKKVQQKLDTVLHKTRENVTGVRVIRAFNLQDEEREDFEEKNTGLNKLQKFVGRISALMNPITYVILNLAIILLIYVGAIRVDVGLISQGAVFALYNYMSQILVELIKLANYIVTLTKAIACEKRISAVLAIENSLIGGEVTEGKNSDIAIKFNDVSLKYDGAGAESLEDLSFEIGRGESVGIIGATGSGKTSLVNLIPRFYDNLSGEIIIDGVNIREYDLNALRSKIGIVPQKSVLFKGSIRDNIKWGKEDATDDEINRAIEIAQAKEVVDSKEGGLDAMVEQGGANFSGGQKQRLAIARALVSNPQILILDDSSSALDYATDARLRQAIQKMEGERTTLVVSQRASTVMNLDKIIVLDDGKAVGIGTHEQLLNTCEVYKEICSSQLVESGGGL